MAATSGGIKREVLERTSSSINNQFNNLNLNQNHKQIVINSFSKSNLSETNGFSGFLVENNKKDSSWQKSHKSMDNLCQKTSKVLNFTDDVNSKDKKKWKMNDDKNSNAKNASTLSLHIAAYENSIEVAPESECISFQKNKKPLKCENSGIHCVPFEFPRSSSDEASEPEVMQFKASQKLLQLERTMKDMQSQFSKSEKKHKKAVASLLTRVSDLESTVSTFAGLKQEMDLLKRTQEKTSQKTSRLSSRLDKKEALATVSITKNNLRRAITDAVDINGSQISASEYINNDFVKTSKFAEVIRDIEDFSVAAVKELVGKSEHSGVSWTYCIGGKGHRNKQLVPFPSKFVDDVVWAGYAEDIAEWSLEEDDILRGARIRVGLKLQSTFSKKRAAADGKKTTATKRIRLHSDDENEEEQI